MGNLRDTKRKARRDLHERAKIPALFISAPGEQPVEITVRVHTKNDALGLKDSENGLAVRRESKPKLLFMRDEMASKSIVLKRGAVVSVEPGEAYRLDNADAPDDISITFFVTVMSANEAAGLPVPGDDLEPAEPDEPETTDG